MPEPVAVEEPEDDDDHDHESEYPHVTSRISAKKNGGREIYVYLNPCDQLEFEEGETRIEVKVNMEGHRRWTVRLGEHDVLGTGRPDDTPPPSGTGGG